MECLREYNSEIVLEVLSTAVHAIRVMYLRISSAHTPLPPVSTKTEWKPLFTIETPIELC